MAHGRRFYLISGLFAAAVVMAINFGPAPTFDLAYYDDGPPTISAYQPGYMHITLKNEAIAPEVAALCRRCGSKVIDAHGPLYTRQNQPGAAWRTAADTMAPPLIGMRSIS